TIWSATNAGYKRLDNLPGHADSWLPPQPTSANGEDRDRRLGGSTLQAERAPVTDVPRPVWEDNDGEDGPTHFPPTVSGSWSDGGGGGGRDEGGAGRYGAGGSRGAGAAARPDCPAAAPKTSAR